MGVQRRPAVTHSQPVTVSDLGAGAGVVACAAVYLSPLGWATGLTMVGMLALWFWAFVPTRPRA
jgi:16S rRNA G1207 methylase RsmC